VDRPEYPRASAYDDVRHLPFEPEQFDAIVSIDAWEYFGTDDHLVPHLARFLRSGGQLGMATPTMRVDPRDLGAIPEHIRTLVGWEALAWHPDSWWRQQWDLTGLFASTTARLQDDGWHDWLLWARALVERGLLDAQGTIDMLEADGGELLTFALVTGRKH
jgi:SAM-dependent methyltransferase